MDKIIETAQSIGMFLAGVAIAYVTCRAELSKFFKKQKGKTKITDNLPIQSAIDVKITERLDYVKEFLDADVIHVYEFHNGEHYADGRSAMKLSCTYEVLRAGVESLRSNCTNIPIACLPKFVEQILRDGKMVCDDIEKLKDTNPSTYSFKKKLGMKSFADYAIRNKENKVVGFIAVIWNDKKKFTCNEAEISKLAYFIEETLISKINH